MPSIPPILLLTFNRPRYVKRILECLQQFKPKKLYVSIDGPRVGNFEDRSKQSAILELLNTIEWKCQLTIRHVKINKGCKLGVASAIDWFFEHEESGVILEDDCLPDPSFFQFCGDLLEKYEHNPQVMSIAGSNVSGGQASDASYFFTATPQCWGWATWRRAWAKYDVQMKDWPRIKNTKLLDKRLKSFSAIQYWTKIFDKTYSNQIDTWDYQWVYTILKNNGLCINPNTNMITNIGFDQDATHTVFAPLDQAFRTRSSIHFPLLHPTQISIHKELDHALQDKLYLTSKWRYYLSLILGTISYRFTGFFRTGVR